MFKPYDYVAYYSPTPTAHFLGWDKVAQYMILRPTGPRIKSYWALYRRWWGAKPETVRIPPIRSDSYLVTKDEYIKNTIRRITEFDQKEMWKILQQGNAYRPPIFRVI